MPSQHESVAAVAHELRLPLSHIKGFVSTLRRTDLEWDEQTHRDFLAEIDLEADRLAALVDSLLDPARPEHGRARARETHAKRDQVLPCWYPDLRLRPGHLH
jgi:K+-sensing histidine kinase KdpD